MNKKIFIVIVASIGLTMFFACTQPKLIPSTISEGEYTVDYLYDDAYRIQEISVGQMMKYSFFYNDQGNIIKITVYDSVHEEDSEYNFSYNRDTVAVKHWIPKSNYESDNFYIINDKGYAKKRVSRNNHGFRYEAVFEYGQVGNLLISSEKESGMFFPGNTTVTSFEYDNAHGIFKNINAPKWFYIFLDNHLFNNSTLHLSMENNVSKRTITASNYPVSYTFTYTYKNDYPETITSNRGNGNVDIASIHYIKR